MSAPGAQTARPLSSGQETFLVPMRGCGPGDGPIMSFISLSSLSLSLEVRDCFLLSAGPLA